MKRYKMNSIPQGYPVALLVICFLLLPTPFWIQAENKLFLKEGILAKYYKNPEIIKHKKIKHILRLGSFDQAGQEMQFYDSKGNLLILDAAIIFYNGRLLHNYRESPLAVFYEIWFIGEGLDDRGRLRGRLLELKRYVLPKL